MTALGREAPIDPGQAALLIIDLQNYCAHAEGGWWRKHEPTAYFFARLHETVLPNVARLLAPAAGRGSKFSIRSSKT